MIAVLEVPIDVAIGERLYIKVNALTSGELHHQGSIYSPVVKKLKRVFSVKLLKGVEVPPLFQPFPSEELVPFLSEPNMLNFIRNNGMREVAERVAERVRRICKKHVPIVFSFEHGVTYGVVKALKEANPKMKFLCFDAHIDAIPLHIRGGFMGNRSEPLTSANFIYFLLNEGILSHGDVIICGVAERFRKGSPPGRFVEELKKMGVQIIEKNRIDDLICNFSGDKVYLSFDADVCTSQRTFAVRRHNLLGVEPERFMDVIRQFLHSLESSGVKICGADLCEIEPLLSDEDNGTLQFWGDIFEMLCNAI